jgi:hypothetical protein
MNAVSKATNLVQSANYVAQMTQFEHGLLKFIDQLGLPTTQVFVGVSERLGVFSHLEGAIEKISIAQKQRSTYLSKFLAAVAAGLFDAALNYLWDGIIDELRGRVARYDLAYFFDIAVGSSSAKRRTLNSEDDLTKIDDSELIQGAYALDLISELGFKQLDYVRYMHNLASVTHSQHQITGLQLISLLETCVREVINQPLPNLVQEIKMLLAQVRTRKITDTDVRQMAALLANLPPDKAQTLAVGLFGMYIQPDTISQTRQNIRLLMPHLWQQIDEHAKQIIGVEYARCLTNHAQSSEKLAWEFLEIVTGLSYVADGIRAAEIQTAIENLRLAHRGRHNLYHEPPFAHQLQRLISAKGKVPASIEPEYVLCVVEAFLTNGNGVAWHADSIYTALVEQFTPDQALKALLAFNHVNIATRLQYPRCQGKFRLLLEMLKTKLAQPVVQDLIAAMEQYRGPLDRMSAEPKIQQQVTLLKQTMAR